jgi:hypothetical protein
VSALQRRLAKLEDVLLPKPRPAVCMLSEPASDAPAEAWAEYRRQVEEATARGDFLILLVPMKPTDRPRTEKGVTYCGSKFEAQLAAASMHPSSRGNKSLLSDVLEDLRGNVFKPRPQAGAYAPGHSASEGDEQEHTEPAITWADASAAAANQAATSR